MTVHRVEPEIHIRQLEAHPVAGLRPVLLAEVGLSRGDEVDVPELPAEFTP